MSDSQIGFCLISIGIYGVTALGACKQCLSIYIYLKPVFLILVDTSFMGDLLSVKGKHP